MAITRTETGPPRRSRSENGCGRSSGPLRTRERTDEQNVWRLPAPVRVKLKRVDCNQAIPYPPDGQSREWWRRLKNAMGTSSSAFVAASLQQLIAAARLPNSGICEIAVNASLAFIEGAKPRDEIECALVIQMACTHSAAMAVLNRLGGAAGDRTVSGNGVRGGTPAARLRHPGRSVTAPARRARVLVGSLSPCGAALT